MAQPTPSGPFTFTSSIQFPPEDMPAVPTIFSFKPGFGAFIVGNEACSPERKSAMITAKLSTHCVFTTVLPILFLYAIAGKVVLAPVCAQLVFYLVTEVVGLSSRISAHLTSLHQQEERKARAIEELAAARTELNAFESENLASMERLQATNEKSSLENADLFTKIVEKNWEIGDLRRDLANARAENVELGNTLRKELANWRSEIELVRKQSASMQKKLQQYITTLLSEKCNAIDAHDKEVAALKTRMDTERGRAALTQRRLHHTIAEQARSERVKIEQLDSVKSELAQAQNELRSTRPAPPLSYEADTRPHALERAPKSASQPSFYLPEDLITLNPLSSGFTCIGTTKKGLRCRQAMIPRSSKTSAEARLERIRSGNPGNAFELPQLQELASWMLCPRWHSRNAPCSQHRELASKWFHELKGAREELSMFDRTVEKDFLTPDKLRPTLFGSNLSAASSRTSASSASSLFSAGSYGSMSSAATSPECSPLAKKSYGSGRRAVGS